MRMVPNQQANTQIIVPLCITGSFLPHQIDPVPYAQHHLFHPVFLPYLRIKSGDSFGIFVRNFLFKYFITPKYIIHKNESTGTYNPQGFIKIVTVRRLIRIDKDKIFAVRRNISEGLQRGS